MKEMEESDPGLLLNLNLTHLKQGIRRVILD